MDTIVKLSEIDIMNFLTVGFIILSAFIAIITVLKQVCSIVGVPLKWFNGRNKDHELLVSTVKEVSELKEKHDSDFSDFTEKQINYREQSLAIQNDWKKTQEQIFETLSHLFEKIDTMKQETDERFEKSEKKQNERVQAELKDKIAESYRRYHTVEKINNMELEALEGLIESYEKHGGKNSFVHSVVQKEMYTWEHI